MANVECLRDWNSFAGITMKIGFSDLELMQGVLPEKIIEEASKALADYIIQHHMNDILEKISPDAIANMAIAHAGAKINETLNKKLPDRVDTIRETKHEVWKTGVLGGLKRII